MSPIQSYHGRPMFTVSDLKSGVVIEFDGAPHVVESTKVSSPTARGGNTIRKVRLRNLQTKQVVDKSFRGNETFAVPDVERRPLQYLYADPSELHFMDLEKYDQFQLRREEIEWETQFLVEGIDGLRALYFNGNPIALELPNTVALTVTETAPGAKGNSATGRTKAATLETGFTIQMPEHIDQGTRVIVDTRTGEFIGRAKD